MLTEKQLTQNFGHLEDHKYKHFNRSLGVQVEGKEHFKRLLAKGKYVPYDMAERLAEEHDRKNPRKPYELSAKARDIIRSIKMTADSKGNICLGNRAIRALREVGLFPTDEQLVHRENVLKEIQEGR